MKLWKTKHRREIDTLMEQIKSLQGSIDWERSQTDNDARKIEQLSKIISNLKEALGIDYEQEQKEEFFSALRAFQTVEDERRQTAKERLDQAFQMWFSTVLRGAEK